MMMMILMMTMMMLMMIFDAYLHVIFVIIINSSTLGEMISIGLVLSRYDDDYIGNVECRLVIECDC